MEEEQKIILRAMSRRWIYMAIAIAASALLLSQTVFSFQDDRGIIYIRSFSMDQKTFYVTQTTLDNGVPEITDTMSVAGLYYCAKAMLYISIACLLCFFSKRWRMWIAISGVIVAGVYYIFMIYYAVEITDNHYTTLSPTIYAILPAVVLQTMILTRRNVAQSLMEDNENEEKRE